MISESNICRIPFSLHRLQGLEALDIIGGDDDPRWIQTAKELMEMENAAPEDRIVYADVLTLVILGDLERLSQIREGPGLYEAFERGEKSRPRTRRFKAFSQ